MRFEPVLGVVACGEEVHDRTATSAGVGLALEHAGDDDRRVRLPDAVSLGR